MSVLRAGGYRALPQGGFETRPYETNWPVCGVARKWVMGGAPPRPGGRPQEPPLQVVVGVGGGCVTGGRFFASLKNDRG